MQLRLKSTPLRCGSLIPSKPLLPVYVPWSILVFSSDILDWKFFSTIYLVIEITFLITQRTLKMLTLMWSLCWFIRTDYLSSLPPTEPCSLCYFQSTSKVARAMVPQDKNVFIFNHSDIVHVFFMFSVSVAVVCLHLYTPKKLRPLWIYITYVTISDANSGKLLLENMCIFQKYFRSPGHCYVPGVVDFNLFLH